jgi:prolyl oligopeptidase
VNFLPTDQTPYPPADRSAVVEHLHGRAVADPYRWLEAADSPDTERWVAAQQSLFDVRRREWSLTNHFYARLRDLTSTGMHGPPSFRGERQFFLRRTADQEHAVLHTVDPDGSERALVDPVQIDPAGTTTLDAYQPSPDGRLLAYQLSEGGTEESALRVLDVETAEVVDGPIDRTRFSPVAWTPDSKAFYYVRNLPPELVPVDEQQYHRRVWLHRLGDDESLDAMAFGAEQDKATIFGCSLSRDGRWLTVSGSKGTDPRNDVWLADLTGSDLAKPTFAVVQSGEDTRAGAWVARDGRMYVWTDRDAPRGRLCVTDPTSPQPEHWNELVPERQDSVLQDCAILDSLDDPLLLCLWSQHAISYVTIHRLADGAQVGEVPLPGLGSVGGLVERYDGGHEAWFTYTDTVSPPTVYRYDARNNQSEVWARPPGTVEIDHSISTSMVEYPSADGTTVRMFVTSNGPPRNQPTILTGYGGFDISMAPDFNTSAISWVEAGGVWAVACLRGGGEEGEAWHRAGMLANKQRVFDDFHGAADHLIEAGWTSADRLGIYGGSNGGLLVGAAMTQRPDLYRAVVCSAPLLDMLRYEQFGLGQFWSGEYGSADDAEQFRTLLAYSPYHRVRHAVSYPATLFTVFASDTRVDPMHARKMCACLQAATRSAPATHPVLYRSEAEVGHGARAITRSIRLSADVLGFQAWATGLSAS